MIQKDKVKIALAQYPIMQHADFESWKNYLEKWILDAVQSDSDLLVFPEYGSMELVSFADLEVQKDLKLQIKYLTELNDKFIETFKVFSRKYSVYILAPTIPFFVPEKQKTVNRAYLFSKTGDLVFQDKLFMTRFEEEEWGISSAEVINGELIQKVFQTEIGQISISTCFDVEFADPAFVAANGGAQIILAPSCTETLKGSHRVHIGAKARALENQFYVGVAQTIGEASWSIATDINNGCAALYCPPDLDFPDDGVLAKGALNKPGWLTFPIYLNQIQAVREKGSVFNFKKRDQIPGFGRIKYQNDVLR